MKIAILALITLSACGSNQSSLIQQPADPTLHAYGDSITAGVGATDINLSYEHLLASDLGVANDNQGVNGGTMTASTHNIVMAAQVKPGDISILMSGFNDITHFGNDTTHLVEYNQDLRDCIERLRGQGSVVLLGTLLRMPAWGQALPGLEAHTDANVELYNNVIRNLAASYNDPQVILVETTIAYDPETMSAADGVHPSDYGHQVLYTTYRDSL